MGMWRDIEKKRAHWSYEENKWGDPAIDVTVVEGGVRIAVTEEKAVDSYNEEFTCSICVPDDRARELMRLLVEYLADDETTEANS